MGTWAGWGILAGNDQVLMIHQSTIICSGFKLIADPEVIHQQEPKASVEPICVFSSSLLQLSHTFQSHNNKYPNFTML